MKGLLQRGRYARGTFVPWSPPVREGDAVVVGDNEGDTCLLVPVIAVFQARCSNSTGLEAVEGVFLASVALEERQQKLEGENKRQDESLCLFVFFWGGARILYRSLAVARVWGWKLQPRCNSSGCLNGQNSFSGSVFVYIRTT